MHNTQSLLPGIKESHITFIRSGLGGVIRSTHFTFDFPDKWEKEPLIPKNAHDLRVGIDLHNNIFINYRINDKKEDPIRVPFLS